VGENPGDEEDHIDIKENEEHGGDVKFYRVAGLPSDFGCKTTFIGRILNFTVPCFLSENVTRDQDSCSHANRQEDLDQDW